jgi:hypothetical protein
MAPSVGLARLLLEPIGLTVSDKLLALADEVIE